MKTQSLKKLFAFALFLSIAFIANAQVTMICTVPSNTPANDQIYIAGTFNGWNPADANYILKKNSDGTLSITLAASTGTIQFKFTRGDWTKVETQSNGADIPNRTFTYGNGDTLHLTIAGWHDLNGGTTAHSTALPQVHVMSSSFFMPQLNRYRKIWIYLPNDYDSSSAAIKKYRVIYMQDGQNLFDDSTSFAGEWHVDETLHNLQVNGDPGAIVIGIENGGQYRLDEYSPYMNPNYGGGQGDEYVDFIVNTLKPYVDANYRTLSDQPNTAIAGSSMGGLISFYAAEKYPNVFSKAGVFSPSLFFNDSIFTYVTAHPNSYPVRFYFDAGRYESSDMVPDIKKMYSTLVSAGVQESNIDTVIKTNGQHNEQFWSQEFPGCYQWLFQSATGVQTVINSNHIHILPNPATSFLNISVDENWSNYDVSIYDEGGKKLMDTTLSKNSKLYFKNIPDGMFILKVKHENEVLSAPFEVYNR